MTAILSQLLSDLPITRPRLRLVEPLPADSNFAESVRDGFIETDVDTWFASLLGEAP